MGRDFVPVCGTCPQTHLVFEASVITVHENEPTQLYEGRDFAIGKTSWTDRHGEQHVFSERWVREDRLWYTRSTGFVVPSVSNLASPRRRPARSARNAKSK
jgi:hypothetical protein